MLFCVLGPSAAQAAPPAISATGTSDVTQTSAILRAEVDPLGSPWVARFQYTPLSSFDAEGFQGAQLVPAEAIQIPAKVIGKGELQTGSTTIARVTTTAGAFGPGETITATGLQTGTTVKEVRIDPEAETVQLTISKPATNTAAGVKLTATGPQPISAQVASLTPASGYRFRVIATNAAEEESPGPAATFYTAALSPVFEACPNDQFRSGESAPFGHPSALLPDCRAYEQVSPVDKNGNDALGELGFTRAAADGSAATFLSTSGIPGGEGAQAVPTYVATRAPSGWATHGLLPPGSTGPRAGVLGWTRDFSQTFSRATRAGTFEEALFIRHDPARAPVQATPYVTNARPWYAGSSADGRTVVFESRAQLPPAEGEQPIAEANAGGSNVYAYDESSGRTSLASVMNTTAETKAALPKGSFAGPYNWGAAQPTLNGGGASANSYLQDQRAVSNDGSLFFTAAGSGQLYRRLNPTAEQSTLDSEGKSCLQPEKACTLHVSTSERAVPDPAGEAPAAFQAASADGSEAFFTSSQMLTGDAHTGPEQPQAQVGRARLNGEAAADQVKEDLLPAHALGVAIDSEGEYIYWANPASGTIGRAKLNPVSGEPEDRNNSYIVPEETKAITEPKKEPGVYHFAPSTPRYVAVDGEFVYWTNTGPLGNNLQGLQDGKRPIEGGGTIGRAKIGPAEGEEAEPEFIIGATNPVGIAVNASHVYWANHAESQFLQAVGRATILGGQVEQNFYLSQQHPPYGVALSSTHVYFTATESDTAESRIIRIPLEGAPSEFLPKEFVELGMVNNRGLAVDSSYVYWASKGTRAIGRIAIAEFPSRPESTNFSCLAISSCDREFLEPEGVVEGLAIGGEHLYWSVNGEAPPNPGSDLYRYSTEADGDGHHLTDLSVDPVAENGAEVKGVLGASPDGSYVYFVANGDLDGAGPALVGNCQGGTVESTSGHCNLYLAYGGEIKFVSTLALKTNQASDALDYAPASENVFGSGSLEPKSSFVSVGGSLVFRSSEQLTSYESEGDPEYYRYSPGGGPILCLTCNPSGSPAGHGPVGENLKLPQMAPNAVQAALQQRNMSADGRRFFFQTAESLTAADTDGDEGCPVVGGALQAYPTCQDVYEWEAAGVETCEVGGPAYSPQNGGCLYLLSPGGDGDPSFFGDASADGDSAFIFTRASLVGQDTDNLLDVYDVRALGGLAAQNERTQSCEGEAACLPGSTTAPTDPTPQTQAFSGPPKPTPKRCRSPRIMRKGHCVKKPHRRHHHKKRPHHSPRSTR